MTASSPLKVLIIGGGVAGPSLAYWLSTLGPDKVHITLLERDPTIRAFGQQIDIRAHGVGVMRRMGIEDAVRAAVVQEKGMSLINGQGKEKAFFPPAPKGSKAQTFTSEFEIMRGDLVKILYRLTEDKSHVVHRFGETVTGWDENEKHGKVTVKFDNGSTDGFDLVVGADGTASRTRRMMLGPDAPDPRVQTGAYIGFFSVPSQPHDQQKALMYHLPGKDGGEGRAIGTRKDRPEVTRVLMITSGGYPSLDAVYNNSVNDANTGDTLGTNGFAGGKEDGLLLAARKKAWADVFRDGGWECERFVKALEADPESDDLYGTPFQKVLLPRGSWSKGQVGLLGDAAHSGTANGLGTSWGLTGAYVLGGEIATGLLAMDAQSTTKAEVVRTALKNYEDKWREVVTPDNNADTSLAKWMLPASKTGVWCLHVVAKIASIAPSYLMPSMENGHSNWKLFDYPALPDGAK